MNHYRVILEGMFRLSDLSRYAAMAAFFFVFNLSFPAQASAVQPPDYKNPSVFINNVLLPLDIPASMRNGEVFIPVTAEFALAMGGEFDLSIEGGKTSIRLNIMDRLIEFMEGSVDYTVDGSPMKAAEAPYLESEGVLMIPAKDLFAALDAAVEWNSSQMKLTVKKKIEEKDIKKELPPQVFTPATATVEVKAATGTTGMTDAEIEAMLAGGKKIQFTYDNTFSLDVDTVSGDKSKSYLSPKQIFQNKISLRVEGEAGHGYKLQGQFNPVANTDRFAKGGEMQKSFLSFTKGDQYLGLYDILPKFSNYELKNYRLQGAELKSASNGLSFNAVAGKSPKKYKDSEYARYVGAARVRRGNDKKYFALNFTAARDTGNRRVADKLDNRVLSVSGAGVITKDWNWSGELARGETHYLFRGNSTRGTALLIQSKRIEKNGTIDFGWEATSADFVSRTSFFTQGKREITAIYNGAAVRKKVTIGTGAKTRLLKGSLTRIFPTSLSIKPLKRRKSLKIDLRQNYERTLGASHSLIDNRAYSVRDVIKNIDITVSRGRKKSRNNNNVTSFRDNFDYKVKFDASEKNQITLQYVKDKAQYAAIPMSRVFRVKIAREMGEWSDMSVGLERYYNGSSSDRYGYTVAYRALNIDKNTEITVETGLVNYRYHNENSLKLRYNIYK